MNGNGTFNGQILVDKLAKLNNSQQSIETLSHWCIFHRKKAKQVVETWDRQFHCSPRDQRVSFLYLANDILQNSRRKGLEFVGEFWKVLPNALNDVIKNGDEFGRKAALRLVDIWEERKVFGARAEILKEELLGRNPDNRNSNGKSISYKLKQPTDMLEKLISSYEDVYGGPLDEDALFGKCRTAISFVEKVEKEMGDDLGNISGSGVEELQGHYGVLRECIEQLKVAESSRMALLSHLREALHEQEFKVEQVRSQLQAAQLQFDKVGNICHPPLIGQSESPPADQTLNEPPPPPPPLSAFSEAPQPPPSFPPESPVGTTGDRVRSTPVLYTQQQQQGPLASTDTTSQHNAEDGNRKTAAAMVAKLAASTSSAQMLSYVLSSFASEGVIGGQSPSDNGSKRPKLENSAPSFTPQPPSQPPLPPFPHPDSLHQPPIPPPPTSTMGLQPLLPQSSSTMGLQPPLPSPMPPLPLSAATSTSQFIQTAGSMTAVPYNYGSSLPTLPSYPMMSMPPYPSPPNPYPSFQGPEGVVGNFGQTPMPAALPPISRQ